MENNYVKRIVETESSEKLKASGAVLIRGPKACGKTVLAKRYAKSILRVDTDPIVPIKMQFSPKELLDGETPRLIDEWQKQPILRDFVRHEVDERNKVGQFILTGSSTPDDESEQHSGAGRFTVIDMNTLSWLEMGYSTGKVSLSKLLDGEAIPSDEPSITFNELIERIIIGGWPSNLGKDLESARIVNRDYLKLISEVDISRVKGSIRRDPLKVKAMIKSLARNISTPADMQTIADDTENEGAQITRATSFDYYAALSRLMIVKEQPAWNTHLRSTAELRKTPKRHFCDVSLVAAALDINKDRITQDPNFLGFIFESLVVQNISIYANAINANVYYYRDSSGNEIDAIVQRENGDWAGFEIKLNENDAQLAAEKLIEISKNIKTPPKSLNIITPAPRSYPLKNGVNVISIASLGI
ncbi:ATPase [Clostridia bacterium]|nr:ATPase [Clostridia bacterium]